MKFLQSATRDDPKMKNTGHGGLDTWFSGHGGGTKDKATWGDWISITPVDHTITKEDDELRSEIISYGKKNFIKQNKKK